VFIVEPHPGTLFFVSMIVSLVAAGASLLTWYMNPEALGLRSWAAALLMASFSNLLLFRNTLQATVPLLLVAGTLFVASFATMWLSLRYYRDGTASPWRTVRSVALLCLAFLAAFAVVWQFGSAPRAYAVVYCLFAGGIAGLAAWEAWRGARQDGLRSRRAVAAGMAGIALAFLARIVAVVLQVEHVVDLHAANLAISYARYLATACMLVVTYGFILMAAERAALAQHRAMTQAVPSTDAA
jgi:hypothetical protein